MTEDDELDGVGQLADAIEHPIHGRQMVHDRGGPVVADVLVEVTGEVAVLRGDVSAARGRARAALATGAKAATPQSLFM